MTDLHFDLMRKPLDFVQEDIWERIQDVFEEQTGQPLPDAALSHHFMQQLLAPGTLCQQALSRALQELGQPLASKHASLEEAQHHLTAAAQVQTFQPWREIIRPSSITCL